ncbi:MAG: hypothetical protein RL291_201, partial [Pseudomonadota bacterium]
RTAIALVVLPAIATNLQVLLTAGHFREMLARFRFLYLAMVPGIVVGLWALQAIEGETAARGLGVVIAVYAALALATPRWRLPERLEGPLQFPVGLANGIVTGLTGSQVMPLFPYIMALGLDPARLVQAVNIAVTGASAIVAAGILMSGIVTMAVAGLSVLAIAPALLGTLFGTRARAHIPAQRFRVIVLAFLGMMGVLLALR